MSYSETRNHFEKARINSADAVTIEMLDGSSIWAMPLRKTTQPLEQHIRNIQEQRMRTEPVLPKANRNA
jgi:hypothetical protein